MACVHFNLYLKRSSNFNTNIEYTYMTIIYDNINFYKQLSHNAQIYSEIMRESAPPPPGYLNIH